MSKGGGQQSDPALDEQLNDEHMEEYYKQQEAFAVQHDLIKAQGGLNWNSSSPNPSPVQGSSQSSSKAPWNPFNSPVIKGIPNAFNPEDMK